MNTRKEPIEQEPDERLSFIFYLQWESQIECLDDTECRKFILNLIRWHKGQQPLIETKTDQIVWNGVLPAIVVNDRKWRARADRSRQNGKLGGRPKSNPQTQQVFEEPRKPDNSKEEIGKSREGTVEGKEEIDKGREVKVEGRVDIEDSNEVRGNVEGNKDESRKKIPWWEEFNLGGQGMEEDTITRTIEGDETIISSQSEISSVPHTERDTVEDKKKKEILEIEANLLVEFPEFPYIKYLSPKDGDELKVLRGHIGRTNMNRVMQSLWRLETLRLPSID